MRGTVLAVLLVLAVSTQVCAQGTAALTLSAALAEANAQNLSIRAATIAVDVARAAVTQAAPSPLEAQVSSGVTQDVPEGLGTLQTSSASASQQFSPALGAQRRAAAAGVDLAQAQLAGVRVDVEQQVVTAYYALASAQAIVLEARQSVSGAQQLENSASTRARVGETGSFEALRAVVERRRAQTELWRARAAERVAQIALNLLLGRTSGAQPIVELPSFRAFTTGVSALYAKAEVVDPQVAQFRAASAAAISQQNAAELQRVPSLGLAGGYLIQRAPSSNGVFSRGPMAQVTLTLPLFDYGTIRGLVDEARARRAVAQAQRAGREFQLHAEIEQDVVGIESARVRLEFSRASLDQTQEALRLAQFGYDHGALGVLDVLSARSQLAAAQSEVTQASADLGASVARLQIVVGDPVSP